MLFTCVLLFFRMRVADRFFYTNPGQFSPEQLNEIEMVSMLKIMCENLRSFEPATNIEGLAFIPPSGWVRRTLHKRKGQNNYNHTGRLSVRNVGFFYMEPKFFATYTLRNDTVQIILPGHISSHVAKNTFILPYIMQKVFQHPAPYYFANALSCMKSLAIIRQA